MTLSSTRARAFGVLLLCLLLLISMPLKAEHSRILMVLWRGETAAEQSFLDELAKQDHPYQIERINADQQREKLAAAFWKMGGSILDYDLVYSFGTTASVMTRSMLRGRRPQLFSMVSDPYKAGLFRTSPTDAVITGTTDAIAAEVKISTAQQIFPIHHIAILFNAREQNARLQLQEMEKLCREREIKLTVLRVAPDTDSLQHQLLRLVNPPSDIDTLYLPSDSYLISQSATIMKALQNTQLRVIGASDTFVKDGALLAISPDYQVMGKQLAQRMISLLNSPDSQQPLAPIQVETPRIVYNEATRKRLGINLPTALQGQMTALTAPVAEF